MISTCHGGPPGSGAYTVSIAKTITKQEKRGITIGPPKSANSVRTIRVPAPAIPALVAAVGGRTSGPLFATSNGRRFPAQNIDGGLRRLLRSLGLPVRGSHTLRHAVASHLVAAGVPLADVARFLGDSVEVVIRNYVHDVGSDVAGAMEKLVGGSST